MTPDELQQHQRISSALYNKIASTHEGRVDFTKTLLDGYAVILMMDTPILEQLLTGMKSDIEFLKDKIDKINNPILKHLTEAAIELNEQQYITLKAFINARPAILADMKEQGCKRAEMLPQ